MSLPKFLTARIMPDGPLISLSQLDSLPAEDPTLQKLGCPTCGSKLVFRHYSSRNRSNLASKEPHSADCTYAVKHVITDSNRRRVTVGIGLLTPDEQSSRSNSAYYRFLRLYEEDNGDTHLKMKRKSRLSITPKPKKDATIEMVPVVEGTVGENADGQHPGIRKHIGSADPLTLSADKIGRTLEVAGVFQSMTIDPSRNYATIKIVNKGAIATLTMNEAFFAQASVGLIGRLQQVHDLIDEHKGMIVIPSAVIEVIPGENPGTFRNMIRSEASLHFNGRTPGMFIHNYNGGKHPKAG